MGLADFHKIVTDPDGIPTKVTQSFRVVEDAVVELVCRGDATTRDVRQRLREALLGDFAPLARAVIADPALQARFELRGIE